MSIEQTKQSLCVILVAKCDDHIFIEGTAGQIIGVGSH